MTLVRLIITMFALLLMSSTVRADELRPGYLELTQISAKQWRMVWKAPIKGGLATRATPALPNYCEAAPLQRTVVNGALVSKANFTCSRSLLGGQIGLTGLDASFSDALARIAPIGLPVQVARLTSNAPMIRIETVPVSGQVGSTYLKLGITHILGGYDHFLFVLALVLLISGGWKIAQAVTAFTVAHSITLIATTLDLISIPRKPVEICIALSIIFLAVEIVKRRPDTPRLTERVPWLVAFLFGLLHGFGFAGALAEIGLPAGDVPLALLSFNVGVEVGQLIIVGVGLLALALVNRFAARFERNFRFVSSYAIGTTAAFWMIERATS